MGVGLNMRALKLVREQRRLDIADVADFTKISPDRLGKFEDGEIRPTRKQLDKLAGIYGVPTYSLFGDSIPNTPDTPLDFRRPDPVPAVLSPRGMRTLWASEKISRFAKQLSLEVGFTAPGWSQATKQLHADAVGADALRRVFDAWYGSRASALALTGPAEQQFLAGLRLFFEVQGGVVNVNDAPSIDYMGFFMEPDAGLPTIFVNRSIASKKAQLFTLVHEYAHALLKAQGVSNPFVLKNKIERQCNAFAAEFLAPMQQFRAVAESVSANNRSDIFQFVAIVAGQSLLSKHATAIRLQEGGYISDAQMRTFEAAWTQFPTKEKEEDSYDAVTGGAPHAKRLSELGYLPVYLAAQGVQRKIIDTIDVQAAIGLSETLQSRAFNLAARRFEVALK
jgi:Zn-dependent peptidase ImmA (M78 family)/transcriptional regulator with XRE-family HTH domain